MAIPDQLTLNFTLAEFERASDRPLTTAEQFAARWWARNVLQVARDVFGPIHITSFVRSRDSDSCHRNGLAVDVWPERTSVARLHRWMATYELPKLGEVLDETRNLDGPHLHLSSRGCGGRGEVLRLIGYETDPETGEPVPVWRAGFGTPGSLLLAGAVAAGTLALWKLPGIL